MNKDIDFDSRHETLVSKIDMLQKEIKMKNNDVGDLLHELEAIQRELYMLMKTKMSNHSANNPL